MTREGCNKTVSKHFQKNKSQALEYPESIIRIESTCFEIFKWTQQKGTLPSYCMLVFDQNIRKSYFQTERFYGYCIDLINKVVK